MLLLVHAPNGPAMHVLPDSNEAANGLFMEWKEDLQPRTLSCLEACSLLACSVPRKSLSNLLLSGRKPGESTKGTTGFGLGSEALSL